MPRRLSKTLAVGSVVLAPAAALAVVGDISREGVLPSGGRAAADVEGAAFSPDGRFLLMTSTSDLAGGAGAYANRQLFMRDRISGRTTLVSSSASGVAANAPVPDIDTGAEPRPYAASLDGRFVVFASAATNLITGDGNGAAVDVFRKDTLTGRVTVVSRDSRGAQPDGGVRGQPSISADGARVAFTSGDGALVAADTNGVADIYLADLRAGSLTLVSRSSAGSQSPAPVDHPSLSADGRAVAFHGTAAASALVAVDSDGTDDVYVARPRARTIVVASTPTGGSDTGASSAPSISGDGSRVAFSSTAPLVAGDAGATPDAFVRDLTAGTTRRISAGDLAGGPAISVNGARVAYAEGNDVMVRSALGTGTPDQASPTASPPQPSTRPAISGTGSLASFTTDDVGTSRSDVWVADVGTVAPTTPALSATATRDGRRVTVSGTARDPAGVISVAVGRRVARLGDDGSYAVTYTAPIGTDSVTVTATTGLGATGTSQVAVTRAAGSRRATPQAPRPRALRVRVARPWARASFTLPVRAAWRVELRRRVAGSVHASAFRLIVARSGAPGIGRRTAKLRLPPRLPAGRYQVRVLMSSAQGLGTAARTIVVP